MSRATLVSLDLLIAIFTAVLVRCVRSLNMASKLSSVFATRDPEKAGIEGYTTSEPADLADHFKGRQFSVTGENEPIVTEDTTKLKRGLKGRHMQMIAIGGAIGAGLFVGSGGALRTGGPGSLVICFIIIVGLAGAGTT